MTPIVQPKLLLIALDTVVVKELTEAARGFQIVAHRNSTSLLPVLAAHPTIVGVIAEYTSKQSNVLEMLQNVRSTRPALRRVVVSDFADLSLVVEGLHTGLLDGIVYRPVSAQELRVALRMPQAQQIHAARTGSVAAPPGSSRRAI